MNARAALVTGAVDYKHGNVTLEGYLAYDDAVQGKRPGVVVVHEWMGLNPYVKMRADQLSKLGYILLESNSFGKRLIDLIDLF